MKTPGSFLPSSESVALSCSDEADGELEEWSLKEWGVCARSRAKGGLEEACSAIGRLGIARGGALEI